MIVDLKDADRPPDTANHIDALRQYQGYERWKAWDESKFGHYALEDGIYYQEELKLCGFVPTSGMQVLEVGFGAGRFAAWATKETLKNDPISLFPPLESVIFDLAARFNPFLGSFWVF